MKFSKQTSCTRCDHEIDESRPACPNCGLWQPWGDRAVAADRSTRLAKFRDQEQKAERAFLQQRHAPEARSQREPVSFRIRRELHLAKFNGARQLGLAVALTFSLTAGGCWMLFSSSNHSTKQSPEPRQRSASTRVVTAYCQDGSDWYGTSRSGACSNHGGVAQFVGDLRD